jgi:NADH-quinone oxidoreductase subunit L
MLAGTLASTASGARVFGFAGFYSKDAIIESATGGPHERLRFAVGCSRAAVQLLFWLLMFLTFLGKPRWARVPSRSSMRSTMHAHGHDHPSQEHSGDTA